MKHLQALCHLNARRDGRDEALNHPIYGLDFITADLVSCLAQGHYQPPRVIVITRIVHRHIPDIIKGLAMNAQRPLVPFNAGIGSFKALLGFRIVSECSAHIAVEFPVIVLDVTQLADILQFGRRWARVVDGTVFCNVDSIWPTTRGRLYAGCDHCSDFAGKRTGHLIGVGYVFCAYSATTR